ncbi:MAG: VCBS repeat-containing protein, partial [Planctomycetes bacterium]|nr:VCBS repeat-containing protein [Planctomycetota bacterium]
DFDGDGDLDLVLSGDTSGSGNVLVTQTWENTFNVFVPLTLKQDLSLMPDFAGVRNESSGNLAWGDYDNDGDLDVFVGGMTTTVRIARIYENNGLGTLTHDAAQTLTAVSQSAAAWGDYDADGDLDLVVTGHDGTQSTATLYVNGAGTLTAHPSLTLVGLHGGSADWADWDGDGDLDLMLSGNSLIPPAAGVRKILFYENDGDGGLTDSGPKGLVGVSLSDAAFGDYDGDGDLDLLCTGDGTVTTPVRIFKIYSNDGTGVFTEVASPELIYRSSGAWGDYDNDGDLDVGLCGYTGTQLRTRIYENTGGAFSHATAYTFPGVRDGSITWADVNEDGRLDFFMTGWDFGGTTYAELYMNLGGDSNTPPTEPGTFTCTVVPGAGGMELGWSGASDGETATAGLYYALRVGTTPGGHEVFSGTYSTPLMGNVGQATAHVLDVPADTYYWSVVAIDSGFMASDWSAEQTCQFCPADLSGNGQADFADILVIIGAWGPCPTPCLEDLNGNDQVDFADILIVIGAWGACP